MRFCMSLITAITNFHPFFINLKKNINSCVERNPGQSVDDLVINSKYPVRTIILGLRYLIEDKQIHVDGYGKLFSSNNPKFELQKTNVSLIDEDSYCLHLKDRKTPSLLCGQRVLIPNSAIERGEFIIKSTSSDEGVIVFLGDDDLVSPYVAKKLKGWKVIVVDIDISVLKEAENIAEKLNANIYTIHADLCQTDIKSIGNADVVVCDPFPSKDGSFEGFFWAKCSDILVENGILITTISPSHKPRTYSYGAQVELLNQGYIIEQLNDSFGKYEVFPFEFTDTEVLFIELNKLKSTVSHTKSILSARYYPNLRNKTVPNFDFKSWVESTESNYLLKQAGLEKQRELSALRGISNSEETFPEPNIGFDISYLIPHLMREKHLEVVDTIKAINDYVNSLGLTVLPGEIEELYRLNKSNTFEPCEENIIALIVRALESWGE
jgi:hypothetical protein